MKLFNWNIREYISKLNKSGFTFVVSSSFINKVISFASGIILVRILSKESYGIFSYANNILSFFMLASGLGASSAILQLCSESKNDDERLNYYKFGSSYGLKINFLLGIIILIVSLIIPLPIIGANECLTMMCFIPLFHLFSDMQTMYLRTELRNKEYAISNSLISIIYFICVCSLSYLYKTKGLILGQYVAYFLAAILVVSIFKVPLFIQHEKLSSSRIKDFFSISLISVVNNGLSRLMYLLDIFVIGQVIADQSVIASYKVATNIPTALQFIPASVVIFIYPYFARNKDNKKWVKDNYKRVVYSLGSFNLLVSVSLFLLAPYIIEVVFGAQYLDSVAPFRILCVSYLFSGTFRVISGNLLITQRKLKFNLIDSILSSATNTVLNIFLILKYNSIGAAWATLITAILSSVVSTVYLVITINRIDKER